MELLVFSLSLHSTTKQLLTLIVNATSVDSFKPLRSAIPLTYAIQELFIQYIV